MKVKTSTITLPEYGKQRLFHYAESFRDIARTFQGKDEFHILTDCCLDESRESFIYKKKMEENRKIMVSHLEEMADLMLEAADTTFSFEPMGQRRFKQISHALKAEGILVKEIYYIENQKGRMEISITMCVEKGKSYTIEEVGHMLSVLLDVRFVAGNHAPYFLDTTYKTFSFLEEPCFCVLTGTAKAVKETENISGDNFSIQQKDTQTLTVLISDGMGSGEKACHDSERVVELAEKLLESGFSMNTMIKMLNHSLMLGDAENNMSTLDVCNLDLYDGICEFVKIGAASSYIKRAHMVEQISKRNLPLGIFSEMEPEITRRKLLDGDYVILVTDGVLDGLSQGIGEEVLSELIGHLELQNPGEMANYILNYVIHQCKGNIRDDMTVIVIGIWETNKR